MSDCFGGAPHALNGEHPLGLAIDASPADGDWGRTEELARRFGWASRARHRLPGRGPFRVILYNGYPGHGDPRHSRSPHIHVSWQHAPAAPFTRAPWVRVARSPVRSEAPMTRARADALVNHDRAAWLREGGAIACSDRLTVLAAVKDVKLDPSPGGLPGARCSQGLVDGLAFWALLAALAALVVGAAVWAWASHSHNHQYTAERPPRRRRRGRSRRC